MRSVDSSLTDIVCSLQMKGRAWEQELVPLQTEALETRKVKFNEMMPERAGS